MFAYLKDLKEKTDAEDSLRPQLSRVLQSTSNILESTDEDLRLSQQNLEDEDREVSEKDRADRIRRGRERAASQFGRH